MWCCCAVSIWSRKMLLEKLHLHVTVGGKKTTELRISNFRTEQILNLMDKVWGNVHSQLLSEGIKVKHWGLMVLSVQEPLHPRAECRWAAWWYRQWNHRHSTWLGIESGRLLWCPATAARWLARFWFLWRYRFILFYASVNTDSELQKQVFLKHAFWGAACFLREAVTSRQGRIRLPYCLWALK